MYFFFLFFFNCVGFYIRLLPWAERLPVFVSGSGVKMAAAPVWAPLLPIQPQPKVWNRLHLILNTWQQLERRKGERRKKFYKKKKKKRKTEWICQRAPSYLPSLRTSLAPFLSLSWSLCSFWSILRGRRRSCPRVSAQLSKAKAWTCRL